MAPLKVIGASVGRSGTATLQDALNMLGYNTHNMRSILEGEPHPERFTDAFEHPELPVDWDSLYEGYDAGVDCPTFCFVDRLMEYYPDAKVILIKRDADAWYTSILNTIFQIFSQLPEDYGAREQRIRKMMETVYLNGSFKDLQKFKDEPETIKANYNAHNDWVIKTVPANRLLVLDLRDNIGWTEICTFLDKPVPEVPFPHKNTTKDLQADIPGLLQALKDKESFLPGPSV